MLDTRTAFRPVQIEGRLNKRFGNFQQFFGQWHQLIRRQTAMSLVHSLRQRVKRIPARTRIIAVFSTPSFIAMASAD
jgi:hypothetical protein